MIEYVATMMKSAVMVTTPLLLTRSHHEAYSDGYSPSSGQFSEIRLSVSWCPLYCPVPHLRRRRCRVTPSLRPQREWSSMVPTMTRGDAPRRRHLVSCKRARSPPWSVVNKWTQGSLKLVYERRYYKTPKKISKWLPRITWSQYDLKLPHQHISLPNTDAYYRYLLKEVW